MDYNQIIRWIKAEYKIVFIEQLRRDLKKKWYAGEIKISELRKQKHTIDSYAKKKSNTCDF